MVNSYFKYPHIELWQTEKWTDKISQVFGLVKWMGANEPYEETVHPMEVEHGDGKKLPCYDNKPNAVNLPETIQYWRDRGVHYECRAQGGLSWLIMAPVSCLDDFGKKLQSVFVMHRTDLSDPWWAMKTLEKFKAYNEKVAQDQDTIVVYICTNGPDTNRIYVNILQEAYVVVPGDSKRIYLDVSPVYNTGHTLKDVEDFRYTDASGNPADPDAAHRPQKERNRSHSHRRTCGGFPERRRRLNIKCLGSMTVLFFAVHAAISLGFGIGQ